MIEHQTPTASSIDLSPFLPLDIAERRVTFKARGFTYTFVFPRITPADWDRCFAGVMVSSRQEGKAQVSVIDTFTAGMKLVEEKIVRVEGYANAAAFLALLNWRELLLPAHTKLAWSLLSDVRVDEDAEQQMDPLGVAVALRAAWDVSDGAMLYYTGLVHRFTPPSAELKRKYNRAMSETRVVGGSRKGATIYQPKQPMLIEMYDQLISSVEGYSVGGRPLTSIEQIRREMDAQHKVVAVKDLFIEPELDEADD